MLKLCNIYPLLKFSKYDWICLNVDGAAIGVGIDVSDFLRIGGSKTWRLIQLINSPIDIFWEGNECADALAIEFVMLFQWIPQSRFFHDITC